MNTQHTGQTGPVFTVKRQKNSGSGCYGVYDGELLVEGGFFNRDAAEECRRVYEEEHSKVHP